MATPNTIPVYPATPRTEVSGYWGGGYPLDAGQLVFMAGSSGSVLDKLVAANSADVPVEFVLSLCGSTTEEFFPIATGSIPAGAGYAAPICNLIPAALADIDGKLVLSGTYPANGQSSGCIYVTLKTAIPEDKTVSILVMASDY